MAKSETIHKIEETFSPTGIRRAFSGTYADWRPALLELVDNSVDARIAGKPVSINVITGPTSLVVSDVGGRGMDLDGLKKLMHWGESQKGPDDIGKYGVGGKSGMVYFGRRLMLACSSDGSNRRFMLEVPDWQRSGRNFEVREEHTDRKEGFVVVEMSKLNYNPRRMTPEAIAGLLGSVYRPMLLSGEVQISVGSTREGLKRTDPINIPYLQTSEFEHETMDLQTANGEIVRASVGFVDPGEFAQNPNLRPGVRVYYRGRMIIDGFYAGLDPSRLPNLVGEVHVKEAAVLTNKTGFVADDPKWRDVVDALKTPLGIWSIKLQGNREEDPRLKDERRLAESAKRDLEGILAETGLLGRGDIPGSSTGRRKPTNPGTRTGGEEGGDRNPPGGRTPPAHDAEGETKRWGALSRWDVIPFGQPEPQAEIYYADLGTGGDSAQSRDSRLRINSSHPGYIRSRIRNERDPLALREYFTQTAAYHIIMEVTRSRKRGDVSYFDDCHKTATTKIAEYYLALSSKGGN